jgi:hypothetical protein
VAQGVTIGVGTSPSSEINAKKRECCTAAFARCKRNSGSKRITQARIALGRVAKLNIRTSYMPISALDAYTEELEDNIKRGVYAKKEYPQLHANGKIERFSNVRIAIYDSAGDLIKNPEKHDGPFYDCAGRMLHTESYKKSGNYSGFGYQRPLKYAIEDVYVEINRASNEMEKLYDPHYGIDREEVKQNLRRLKKCRKWMNKLLKAERKAKLKARRSL